MVEGKLDQSTHSHQKLQRSPNGVLPGVGEVVKVIPVDGLAHALNERVLNNDACKFAIGINGVNLQALEIDDLFSNGQQ
jgi:hypothetical protein